MRLRAAHGGRASGVVRLAAPGRAADLEGGDEKPRVLTARVCGPRSRSATGGARLLEDILRWGSEALFARPEGGAPAAPAADAAATAALAGDAAGPGSAAELKPGAAGAPAPPPRAQGEGKGYSDAALDRLVAGPLRAGGAAGGGGTPGAPAAGAADWAAAVEAGGLGPGLEQVAVREWRGEALEDEEAGSDGARRPRRPRLRPRRRSALRAMFSTLCVLRHPALERAMCMQGGVCVSEGGQDHQHRSLLFYHNHTVRILHTTTWCLNICTYEQMRARRTRRTWGRLSWRATARARWTSRPAARRARAAPRATGTRCCARTGSACRPRRRRRPRAAPTTPAAARPRTAAAAAAARVPGPAPRAALRCAALIIYTAVRVLRRGPSASAAEGPCSRCASMPPALTAQEPNAHR